MARIAGPCGSSYIVLASNNFAIDNDSFIAILASSIAKLLLSWIHQSLLHDLFFNRSLQGPKFMNISNQKNLSIDIQCLYFTKVVRRIQAFHELHFEEKHSGVKDHAFCSCEIRC